MGLTRQTLSKALATRLGLSSKEARDLVDLMFEEIARAVAEGENVKLSGFGSVRVRQSPQRIGRNPKTGEPAVICKRQRVSFKPSNRMLAAIQIERGKPS